MKPRYLGLIYTRDQGLARRLLAYVNGALMTSVVEDAAELERHFEQGSPILLMLDVRAPHALAVLDAARDAPAHVVSLVFGVTHSVPMQAAMAAGAFALEETQLERAPFQARLKRAVEHLALMEQIRHLQDLAQSGAQPSATVTKRSSRPSMVHFSRALRHIDDLDVLIEGIVEGVAGAMTVSRVGLFARRRPGGRFAWRAGIRCLQSTRSLEYLARDPLVQWLEIHAHLVSRSNISHVSDPGERSLLKQALDVHGAEILLPLQARGNLVGWLYIGQRSTGIPFEEEELEELLTVSEHCAIMLDNALLYEEIDVQKTLASTVLESLPTGIVTINRKGAVTWMNQASCALFACRIEEALQRPIDQLSARLGTQMRATLAGGSNEPNAPWEDRALGRTLVATVHLLERNQGCDGAVALVRDITVECRTRAQQEEVERTAFWTELAASMSHEVRNPLVAIKTFAQLLPERFDDREFRDEFSRIVPREVDRLNRMIEQIDDFAHPAELERLPVDLKPLLRKAVDRALDVTDLETKLKIETDLEPDLPYLLGDEKALLEGLRQIIKNAREALVNHPEPLIRITARTTGPVGSPQGLRITVADNGPGIPAELKDRLFSPFSTTKARGMGLGLPIARRCAVDHDGRLEVQCGSLGTAVVMELPLRSPAEERLL